MFEDVVERTELSSLGKFKLINEITSNFKLKNKSSLSGVGDDCAVLKFFDKEILVSTDLLVEGIHFDMIYTPLKHLGYKSATINFSDIYAMNGTPKQILVSIAVSNRFSLEAIKELYAGIKQACKNYNVDLVGGDTSSSNSGLFISITVIGEADGNKITYRNGAKTNDLICVSGNLGASYMGLMIMEREKVTWQANPEMQPDLTGNEYVLQRFLRPEARFDICEILNAKNIIPSSMIDISGGLVSDLYHLCTSSNKGCNVYENKIPIDPATILVAEEFNINPVTAACNGGEDYELLFTIRQSDYDAIKNIPQISVIGHITDDPKEMSLITNDNKVVELRAQGWE